MWCIKEVPLQSACCRHGRLKTMTCSFLHLELQFLLAGTLSFCVLTLFQVLAGCLCQLADC